MKRKYRFNLIYVLAVMILSFLSIDNVYAGNLEFKNVTLECIYSDGSLFTYSHNSTTDEYVMNRRNYNLKDVSTQDSSTTGRIEFTVGTSVADDSHLCKQYLISGSTKDRENDSEDSVMYMTYYKFSTSSGATFETTDFSNLGVFSFFDWFAHVDSSAANETKKEATLVSERYILESNSGEPTETLYYVQKSTQETGENRYITIYKYDNATLLDSGKRVTRVTSTSAIGNDVIWINNPEPESFVESSSILTYFYKDGQIRYTATSNKTSSNINKYEKTDSAPPTDSVDTGELCSTIMPNTSVYLRTIIKYAQWLVPIFLIVLTSVDVGKIVLAGNIEEELPKQKKKIIVRFVVALVFFFLPTLAILLVKMLQESGGEGTELIQQIGCLFE